MNLFQTSPVVTSIVDWTLQSRITKQKGDIDTSITTIKEEGANVRNEETNKTSITREVMRDLSPIVPFILGRVSKSNDDSKRNDNRNDKGGTSGNAPLTSSDIYEVKSREWDQRIKESEDKSTELAPIAKSFKERLNDSAESLSKALKPLEPVIPSLGIGSSLLQLGGIPIMPF